VSAGRAILLTPPGSAAIAVVRVAGREASAFVARHFAKAVAHGRCVHGDLTDGGHVIDDVVVVAVGATTFDINTHGGNWVVRSVLDLAAREGFQVIERGAVPLSEPTIEADTTLEREVLSHLPLARTEMGVRTLTRQPVAWSRLIDQILADPNQQQSQLERVLKDETLHHLLYPPSVAIMGPPNVGKSTLANQLFGRERSITADMPGTTRDWVGEFTEVGGLPVMLLDTPGLRITRDAIESAAIDRSRGQIDRVELVVLVLDASLPLEGEAARLIDAYPGAIRTANKCDRPCQWDVESRADVRLVATQGVGVPELRRRIVKHFCGESEIIPDRAYLWTDRQRDICQRGMQDPSALREAWAGEGGSDDFA
jgi:tRNA modification GTPase